MCLLLLLWQTHGGVSHTQVRHGVMGIVSPGFDALFNAPFSIVCWMQNKDVKTICSVPIVSRPAT